MYVVKYKRQVGRGGAAVPYYALGVKPNAELPIYDRYTVEKRYRDQPKNMERILANQRRIRREDREARTAGKNAFRLMAQPIIPVILPTVAVRVHECVDDDELPKPRKYVRKSKALPHEVSSVR